MQRAATVTPPDSPQPAAARRDARVLRYAALLFAAGLLVHTADHFRRGLDVITDQVFWAGNVSAVIVLAAVALALAGHRLAPWIAVAVGFSQALGVAAVHLPPDWGAFSDALADGGVDALSWLAVLAEIAGAATFGAAGLYVLRPGQPRAAAR